MGQHNQEVSRLVIRYPGRSFVLNILLFKLFDFGSFDLDPSLSWSPGRIRCN
jgi:hypothetical protein